MVCVCVSEAWGEKERERERERERVECGAVSDCVDTYIDKAGTDIVTHIVLRRQNNPLITG